MNASTLNAIKGRMKDPAVTRNIERVFSVLQSGERLTSNDVANLFKRAGTGEIRNGDVSKLLQQMHENSQFNRLLIKSPRPYGAGYIYMLHPEGQGMSLKDFQRIFPSGKAVKISPNQGKLPLKLAAALKGNPSSLQAALDRAKSKLNMADAGAVRGEVGRAAALCGLREAADVAHEAPPLLEPGMAMSEALLPMYSIPEKIDVTITLKIDGMGEVISLLKLMGMLPKTK